MSCLHGKDFLLHLPYRMLQRMEKITLNEDVRHFLTLPQDNLLFIWDEP